MWPLYCLSFLDLRLLITLCYHVAIVESVLPRFTTSDYHFGILWALYCLSFLDLRLLITPLVSFGHCGVCTSSIYDLWLSFWYLVAIVLSVLPRFTTSDYSFGILWPFYCLSFLGLRLLITPLATSAHCIVYPSSIYDFWLPLWYLVAIVLSVLPRFTTSYYPFGILLPLCCLSVLDLRLLITRWYLAAIVLSILPRFTTSDYPFGILWPLYYLYFLDLRLLITPLATSGHCIVCPSSIYDFWLPLWYLVAIVLSVLPRFTTSDYPFGIMWPLYCLAFLDLRLLITLWYFVDIALSVLPRFTTFDYPLASSGHCIVCPSSIYDFWLPFWYPVAIVLSVLPRFTTSDYPFGIFWSFFCLSFLDLRLLITPLESYGHCIVFPSSIYDFWLPLWYLVAVVLSVLPRLTNSDYPFVILWPLYVLSFLDLRLLITPLVSFGHCVVCTSSIYDLWLSFWYLVAIVLSVLPRFTTSDYSFGILWPLYCPSFLGLRLLITQLVSCGHCIVCPSSIYDFWLPLWYLVAIVLSVLPQFTTSDYPFVILWLLYCLSFLDLWLLITPFVSCGHCTVYPSLTDDFSLHLWYLVAIVLSVPTRFTTSDYPFGSCGHWVVCPSSIYDFWLLLWYLVAILLSVLPRVTTSDYPFGN